MDQSQHSVAQATQEQLDELINEIAFQKVLLSSIDDSVQNRQEAEDEVKAEIKSLEKQVRELKRSTTSAALNSHNSSASQPFETSSSNQSSSTNPSGSHTMDDTLSGTPLQANQGLLHFSLPFFSWPCMRLHLLKYKDLTSSSASARSQYRS